MTSNLLERLAAVDPHPVDADPPTGAVTAAAVLHDIEWRSDMQTRQKPTVTSTQPRWGVRVAVAAFAVVIIVGVIAALVATGGSGDPADETPSVTTTLDTAPTTTLPNTTSTLPPSTTTTAASALELSASQLLSPSDLPAPSDWQLYDEATGVESLGGFVVFQHGVLAIRCEPEYPSTKNLAFWALDPGPQTPDPDDTWQPLDKSQFRAMFTDRAVVGEALYLDSTQAVADAFEMMTTVTTTCLDDELFGSEVESRILDLPDVGDERIGVEAKAPLGSPSGKWDIFHLAIIRDRDRLLIVEHHETIASHDDPLRVTDAEFIDIVETAADHLER